MIDRYLDSIVKSLECKNWYAALFIALTIPDICGALENPDESSSGRYVSWYDKYMLPKYSSSMGPLREVHVFLSGDDCYALRCSLLHEGTGNVGKQRISKTLESVHFNEPSGKGGMLHCNQYKNVLQLQVDIFCDDFVDAARQWLSDVQGDAGIQTRMQLLSRMHPAFYFPGFIGSSEQH
jgi:hypothetical protein